LFCNDFKTVALSFGEPANVGGKNLSHCFYTDDDFLAKSLIAFSRGSSQLRELTVYHALKNNVSLVCAIFGSVATCLEVGGHAPDTAINSRNSISQIVRECFQLPLLKGMHFS